jgi:hypothetical protein
LEGRKSEIQREVKRRGMEGGLTGMERVSNEGGGRKDREQREL